MPKPQPIPSLIYRDLAVRPLDDLDFRLEDVRQKIRLHDIFHRAERGDLPVLHRADAVGVPGREVDIMQNRSYCPSEFFGCAPEVLHHLPLRHDK